MTTYLYNPHSLLEIFKKYSMHIFGIFGFIFTFALGLIAFLKDTKDLAILIPYGILIFALNLFYLKLIRISRQEYEDKLKKEKQYSQDLLKSQKLFLRYAVHETNTPLAVIMANIELYELESGENEALSNIAAATKNIYGIYDDLSYLTKRDKMDYTKQKIVLSEFIRSRIEFFSIVAKQSKLSFDFIDNCKETIININETKLQRIIDNNITNAIKYTKAFNRIQITLLNTIDHCIFEISSNSTLIKDPEKIFNAYYRENNVKDGLGLGLNLVKTICNEEHIKTELQSTDDNTSFKYHFSKGQK